MWGKKKGRKIVPKKGTSPNNPGVTIYSTVSAAKRKKEEERKRKRT